MLDKSPGFLDALEDHVLISDGAVGTMMYEKGIFVNRCFDELNLSDAALVQSIHKAYVDVGAQVVETNTFGANSFKLEKFGLEKRTADINRLGVETRQ